MMIRDYNTAETIRTATADEIATYEAIVAALPSSEREAGAVDGARIAGDLAGRVVYVA
jgi:hypothetical protein